MRGINVHVELHERLQNAIMEAYADLDYLVERSLLQWIVHPANEEQGARP